MTFQIVLAGKTIQIEPMYDQVYHMCKEYIVEETQDCIDIYVRITEKDIELEHLKSDREYHGAVFSDAYLETLAVYRQIAVAMLSYDCWLMHGAVLAINDNAYMLTASSGTGKTTVVRMALKNFEGSYVINGDKPLLQIKEDGVYACGTPWSGKECMNRNFQAPLKGIFILERGEVNQLKEISFIQAFPILLQQTYRPDTADEMKKTLTLLSAMSDNGVRFYKLSIIKYDEVAELDNEEVTEMLMEMVGHSHKGSVELSL